MAKVLKSFTTTTRRFAPGDDFDPATDCEAAMPLDHLVDKGFVEGPPQPKSRNKSSIKESKS